MEDLYAQAVQIREDAKRLQVEWAHAERAYHAARATQRPAPEVTAALEAAKAAEAAVRFNRACLVAVGQLIKGESFETVVARNEANRAAVSRSRDRGF